MLIFWVKKLAGANFYAFCNYGRVSHGRASKEYETMANTDTWKELLIPLFLPFILAGFKNVVQFEEISLFRKGCWLMIKVFRPRPKGVMTRQAIARAPSPRDHRANYHGTQATFYMGAGENTCAELLQH